MKTPAILIAFLLLCAAPLLAQDFVRKNDGTMVRGEILKQTDEKIVMVNELGETVVIAAADVKKLRKGKGLQRKTKARLEEVKEKTPEALWEVAVWCATFEKNVRMRRDAQRLARRVLVKMPEHKEARAFLGHVKALGNWYVDAETAHTAVQEKMTADGFVYVDNGWIRAERAGDLAQRPDEWILVDEFLWRPLAEVMKERGYELWRKVWYPKEDKHLIPALKKLSDKMGLEFHGHQVDASICYSVLGRESAIDMAKDLAKARAWFCKTFETDKHGPRRNLASTPVNTAVVLGDKEELGQFAEAYAKQYGVTEQQLDYTLRLNMMTWRELGHAHNAGETIWRYQLVSQLGGRLIDYIWHGGFDRPPWIWIASAHHAEITVYETARVPYIAESKYGQRSARENVKGRSISDARDRVKEMVENKERISIRELMGRPFNAMTQKDDDLGLVLFQYLLEVHKEGFYKFLMGPKSGNLWDRWDRCIGKSLEEVEGEFKDWL